MRHLPAFVFVALLAAPSLALACSCDDPPDALTERDRVDAVVEVRLVEEQREPFYESDDDDSAVEGSPHDLLTYRFEVDAVWKGDLEVGDEVTLHTNDDCCECQRTYSNIGSRWLLYLTGSADGWSDGGLCSRTARLDAAACDIAAFETPGLPCDEAEVPSGCQGCATAGGASLLPLLVLLRRRNRTAPTATNQA